MIERSCQLLDVADLWSSTPDSQRSRLATIFGVDDSVPRDVDPNRPGLGVHRLGRRPPPLRARLAQPGDGLFVEPVEDVCTSWLATNGFVQPHRYSSAITSATGSTLADRSLPNAPAGNGRTTTLAVNCRTISECVSPVDWRTSRGRERRGEWEPSWARPRLFDHGASPTTVDELRLVVVCWPPKASDATSKGPCRCW
jgi:hypothetical protein